MTEGTMENSEDAGRFRLNDDVVVEDGITHEIVHTPPSYKDIPDFIEHLCDFFNEESCKSIYPSYYPWNYYTFHVGLYAPLY